MASREQGPARRWGSGEHVMGRLFGRRGGNAAVAAVDKEERTQEERSLGGWWTWKSQKKDSRFWGFLGSSRKRDHF